MRRVHSRFVPGSVRPPAAIWQVLIEQEEQKQAVFYIVEGKYAVKFIDEAEPIPFNSLAYSKELGLYDIRKFPNSKERSNQ